MDEMLQASAGAQSAEPRPERLAWLWVGVTVLAAGIGVALRWYRIGLQSLWFDEGYSAWVSGLPPAEIVRIIRHDISPPTYYLLLHAWRAIFGDSETALRAMSATFGCVSMGVMYLLGRRLLQRPWAVALAVMLLAFSPLQIQYAQEARFYEMASVLLVLSLYGVVAFLQRRSWAVFAGVVVCSTLMVYTHNMMFFYLAGLNAAWLVLPGEATLRRRVWDVAIADALVGVLYLPWVPSLLGQMRWIGNGNFWAEPAGVWQFLQTGVIVAGFKHLHLPVEETTLVYGLSGLVVAAVVWGLCGRGRRAIVGLLMVGLLPLLLVYGYSLRGIPVFIERVFVPSSAIFPLLFAGAMLHRGRVGKAMGAIAVVAAIGLSAGSAYGLFVHERKENWRDACAYVDAIPAERRLIVFVANEGELLYRYYAGRTGKPDAGEVLTGVPASFFDRDPPQTIQRVWGDEDLRELRKKVESGEFREIVFFRAHTAFSDPKERVRTYLDRACMLEDQREFWNVEVLRYRVR